LFWEKVKIGFLKLSSKNEIMNSNSLENDELLEKSICKFVNDRNEFQSRHYKNPNQKPEPPQLSLKKLQSMPITILLQLIFQKNKKHIHHSFRKDYFSHLQSLSREELVNIALSTQSKNNEMDFEQSIRKKLNL